MWDPFMTRLRSLTNESIVLYFDMTVTTEQRDNYITCLLRAQEFEMFWKCYHDCFGQELEKETREAAVRFFEIFEKLPELTKEVRRQFSSNSIDSA